MALNILIVDDDGDDVDFLTESILHLDSSAQCKSVHNGQDALTYLRSLNSAEMPNYIFLDLNMPRVSGRQFLMIIKNSPELKNLPIVVYTTSQLEKDKKEIKELGALHFITKPTNMAELLHSISFVFKDILVGQPAMISDFLYNASTRHPQT